MDGGVRVFGFKGFEFIEKVHNIFCLLRVNGCFVFKNRRKKSGILQEIKKYLSCCFF